MGQGTGRRGIAGAFALLATTLLTLALAPSALAGPPFHIRDAARDVTGLDHACGTAVDSKGDLYAASAGEAKIEVFSPSDRATPIATIANSHEPCALAVDGYGDLLVSERETGDVVLYAPDSYPLSPSPSYGPPVSVVSSGEAQGISVDPSDERLYVAEGDRVSTYGIEIQQLRVANATGGDFKLRFEGEETSSLPYNASAEAVQEALEALPAIGPGAVTVTGAGTQRVLFHGALAYLDVPQVRLLPSLQGNEVQRVVVQATTGNYTLTFEGQETAAIPYNAPANQPGGAVDSVQEYLEALPNLDPGDVSVSGGPGDAGGTSPYEIAFAGAWAARNVAQMTRNQAGLGTGKATVSTKQEGAGAFATTSRSGGLGTDEAQVFSVANASGGTYKLSFEGQETPTGIKFDASPEEVEAALEGLSSVGLGGVSVASSSAPTFSLRFYTVEFQGPLAHTDVLPLGATSSLTGSSPSVGVLSTSPQGFGGAIGTGDLGEATGVAAYTHNTYAIPSPEQVESSTLYLGVADAQGDALKTFTGAGISTLKLRRTIAGVDADEDPETPDQQFGFGAAGAYLAADPGNADPKNPHGCLAVEEQACTAGHLFLYDAAHEALDELDATGEFLDQIAVAGLEDAEPTQVAVDRSGSEADGTLYASSGAGSGAGVLAFAPLRQPHREALEAPLSHVLTHAQAVATDDRGDLYVAAEATVYVYSPAGALLTSFAAPAGLDLAVDSQGNVYDVLEATSKLFYYHPSKYPPDGSTVYAKSAELANTSLLAVAVNPANDRPYLYKSTGFGANNGSILVFKAAAEGSGLLETCGEGLGLPGGQGRDVDVYGATGEVYVSANVSGVLAVRCGVGGETIRRFAGNGCPGGRVGPQPAIAVDQANGHVAEFEPNQGGNSAREYDASGACVAQFGSFSNTNAGYRVAVDNSCALREPPLIGAACEAFDPSYGNVYVAFDSEDNGTQPYDLTAFGSLDYGEPPAEYELKVTVTGSGQGTVASSPAGVSSCSATCSANFEEGTEVTLSASPEAGSTFAGWSGAGCSGTGTCEVTMDEAKQVTASFAEEVAGVPLAVSLEGTGTGTVSSSPGLISCSPFCDDEFPGGTHVTLTASPAAGSLFTSWKHCDSGGVNGRQCTVTMDEAKQVTAVFVTAHRLSLAKADGSGPGKVQSKPGGAACLYNCQSTVASFKEGAAVELVAIPAKHFHLDEWGGDCSGPGPCQLVMGEDHDVEASFAEDPKFPLELTKAGSGQGVVRSHPAGIACSYTCSHAAATFYGGAEVVLEVSAVAKGSTFAGWSGGGCSGTDPCTVTVDGPKAVQAEFE